MLLVVYLESDLREHRLFNGREGWSGKEAHAGCANNEEMSSVSGNTFCQGPLGNGRNHHWFNLQTFSFIG